MAGGKEDAMVTRALTVLVVESSPGVAVGACDELIAAGILHPPAEAGDPFEDWPDISLPPGTAAELIDSDRGEA